MKAHAARNNRVNGLGVCEASPGKVVTTPAHGAVSVCGVVFRGKQTLSRWMTLGKIKDEEEVTENPQLFILVWMLLYCVCGVDCLHSLRRKLGAGLFCHFVCFA